MDKHICHPPQRQPIRSPPCQRERAGVSRCGTLPGPEHGSDGGALHRGCMSRPPAMPSVPGIHAGTSSAALHVVTVLRAVRARDAHRRVRPPHPPHVAPGDPAADLALRRFTVHLDGHRVSVAILVAEDRHDLQVPTPASRPHPQDLMTSRAPTTAVINAVVVLRTVVAPETLRPYLAATVDALVHRAHVEIVAVRVNRAFRLVRATPVDAGIRSARVRVVTIRVRPASSHLDGQPMSRLDHGARGLRARLRHHRGARLNSVRPSKQSRKCPQSPEKTVHDLLPSTWAGRIAA
jgi:hypothetical protein